MHQTSSSRGSGLLAPLRWLGRKLSGLVRRVAKHVPAPLRWLGRLFAPGRERGFGFWWLVATLGPADLLSREETNVMIQTVRSLAEEDQRTRVPAASARAGKR